MSDPTEIQTLTPREMALAKWILQLSEKVAEDDRHQAAMLCGTAAFLIAADEEGNMPEPTKPEQRFVLTIKQGCEARGGKRSEAAFACLAAAMAVAKIAEGKRA